MTARGLNEKGWPCVVMWTHRVRLLCRCKKSDFVGGVGGTWGEGLPQSSLAFILQRGVAMETAPIIVAQSRWLLLCGRSSSSSSGEHNTNRRYNLPRSRIT